LLSTDFFKDKDELIIDELVTFFLAGMKTIQISTTNLIYYLTKYPDIRAKLMNEIRPPLDKLTNLEELSYEEVMDFEYLAMCYNESLRIEPPVASSSSQAVINECEFSNKGQKFRFKPETQFAINFEAIHHDKKIWLEPSLFVPERFDSKTEGNKWYLTPDGNQRNPMAFTPFMGGKRVCLGKTFAEVNTRFTVPLLYHFFDFEFVDPK
jgi:cytochrome P450